MSGAVKKRDYSLESPDSIQTDPTHRYNNGPSTSGTSVNHQAEDKPRKSLGQVVKSKFFLSVVAVCALIVTLLCIGLVVTWEKDNDVTATIDAWNDKLSVEQLFWFDSGLNELKHALGQNHNTRRAKNVILFVADGMGPATVTAARIYKDKEEGSLIWERFPHMGLLKVSIYQWTVCCIKTVKCIHLFNRKILINYHL